MDIDDAFGAFEDSSKPTLGTKRERDD